MDGAVWTMIAILAGSQIATLVYLGNKIDTRIDSSTASLGARIDSSTASLGARIDALGADLRADIRDVSGRIDALGAGLRADIRDLTVRTDAVLTRLTDHELGHRRPRPNHGA